MILNLDFQTGTGSDRFTNTDPDPQHWVKPCAHFCQDFYKETSGSVVEERWDPYPDPDPEPGFLRIGSGSRSTFHGSAILNSTLHFYLARFNFFILIFH